MRGERKTVASVDANHSEMITELKEMSLIKNLNNLTYIVHVQYKY